MLNVVECSMAGGAFNDMATSECSLIVRQDHRCPSHSMRSRLTRKSGHTSPTFSSGVLLLPTEKLSASLFLQRPWVPQSSFSFGERALPPQKVLFLEKMDAPTCVASECQPHPSRVSYSFL